MIWPTRFVLPLLAFAIPVQVWIDRGPLFGLAAAATFPPMILLGTFAREWLLRPRPPGPRLLAPAGPLPIALLVFVTSGWLLEMTPADALLVGVAVYLPLAVLAVVRHPARGGPERENLLASRAERPSSPASMPLSSAHFGPGTGRSLATLAQTIDDETLHTAILNDVAARRISPWPATQQNGKLIDAHALLSGVQQRTGDKSLTLQDLDQAMRRVHAHRLNFPLSRVTRAVLRALLRSDRPSDRPPAYFIDDWTWRREISRLPRRRRRPQ